MNMGRNINAVFLYLLLSACSVDEAELFTMPDQLKWGANVTEIERLLEGQCANGFNTRPIDPPFLPMLKDRQFQIDCDGLEFMGGL